ncbi:hypothetical protein Scep_011989 [Stephania cephalantha]|uniref:starch synthase n=1 Tax=Stephania cephalantha TaxID=152367 RepID=A0AAP0P9G5_9MAGN
MSPEDVPMNDSFQPDGSEDHTEKIDPENLDASLPAINLKNENHGSSDAEGSETEDNAADTISNTSINPDQESTFSGEEHANSLVKSINSSEFHEAIVLEDSKSLVENSGKREPFSNIRLDDLIGMIKNAEKNILLLNQARIRALEDLDKILTEKEALQGEINILETKLAETDARIKVAAQEKVHVELLEGQLEKLKNELSERHAIEGIEHDMNKNDGKQPFGEFHSLHKELKSLRKENLLLKTDVETLKETLSIVKETDERVEALEKERSSLAASVKDLEFKLTVANDEVSRISNLKKECMDLWEKIEDLQGLLDSATKQADHAISILEETRDLRKKVTRLEESLEEANSYRVSSEKIKYYNELMQQKIKLLEERLQRSDEEILSHVQSYQDSVKEFQVILTSLKEERKRRASDEPVDDMPWEFWSQLLLLVDGWLFEKKISPSEARLLRKMVWKRDGRIYEAYMACKGKNNPEIRAALVNLVSSGVRAGLHVIHIAAEMAPIAKVGGLGDVVTGLSKALQKKGHLVEVVLPKYDCMQHDRVNDLRALDVLLESYFEGRLHKNKIWVGTVEGLPVYFIEPHHPSKFFWRGQFYGEHDDFKRFSYFSRAALELLLRAGKKPDIIHCHDWQTAFVAPLYWDLYASKGLNSARICFTCHNFEYQGTAPAKELSSCGLDAHQLNRPDRMQDNSAHDTVNPVKGAVVFSNIVTTVSPTYAQEVRTAEGGRGLDSTLNFHSRKFVGILNGIDTDAWNPSTDNFLKVQYSADDIQGKKENKQALRKNLKLSMDDPMQPLVCCITRLVPQKGVHLIRHAMYRTIELGGQFVLLGSSPVQHIQSEFEGIANHFRSHPQVRLILKYDEALSHLIYAASDMFIIPSMFEPCGLTQMIAMRYGSVPITRKTGGLNDSVFDVDDDNIPARFRNGFTFLSPDEQGVSSALERAFDYYTMDHESWRELVYSNMKIDFSWDSSAEQYIELYEQSVARARTGANRA